MGQLTFYFTFLFFFFSFHSRTRTSSSLYNNSMSMVVPCVSCMLVSCHADRLPLIRLAQQKVLRHTSSSDFLALRKFTYWNRRFLSVGTVIPDRGRYSEKNVFWRSTYPIHWYNVSVIQCVHLKNIIMVVDEELSFQHYFQHYSGTTITTEIQSYLKVHRQVCCDIMSSVAIKNNKY